ncbi:MAG: NAD-dependent epimerase/dehydratase family protein [Mangrovibacterium sp.]
MQTILGSGGAIGNELAGALQSYTEKVRLVSRSPRKVNPGDELMPADLLNPDQTRRAVKGSDVVYVTVGLPYRTKVWEESWPRLMSNVISACKEHNCRLVFFDNVYMYDPDKLNKMTEETPVNPSSNKGRIRTTIVRMIMDEVERGELQALIARSADFYGPGLQATSVLSEVVIKPLSSGRRAMWMGPVNYKHSFTYTRDAGNATALLGNTPDAWNQVWHLPTASNPYTGREWIEIIARELGVEPKYFSVPKWMMKVSGLFVPLMKELEEMMYQYDRDYVFDSSRFERRFGILPTPYHEGVKEAVRDYKALGKH